MGSDISSGKYSDLLISYQKYIYFPVLWKHYRTKRKKMYIFRYERKIYKSFILMKHSLMKLFEKLKGTLKGIFLNIDFMTSALLVLDPINRVTLAQYTNLESHCFSENTVCLWHFIKVTCHWMWLMSRSTWYILPPSHS